MLIYTNQIGELRTWKKEEATSTLNRTRNIFVLPNQSKSVGMCSNTNNLKLVVLKPNGLSTSLLITIYNSCWYLVIYVFSIANAHYS